MPDHFAHLQINPLRAADQFREFETHQAALDWSLADPIIIQSAEDIKSSVHWRDRIQPFRHQVRNLMTFCARLPVSLIADDVGLGKTISAGLILSELMTRRRVSRTLVICKSALGPQWVQELESKFGIEAIFATGFILGIELSKKSPVLVTTYESARGKIDRIKPGSFDFLILDEAHHLRNLCGTPSPPKFAERIRHVLAQRYFKYVVMLTATPIQNRPWDIYSLIECLAVAKGHANPFGDERKFRSEYIADQAGRQLKPHVHEQFRSILQQYLVRTRRADAQLLFPSRQVRLVADSPRKADLLVQEIVGQAVESMNGLEQSSLMVAMMSSPEALCAQLSNMAGKRPELRQHVYRLEAIRDQWSDTAKLNGLDKIIDQLREKRPGDWRLLIYTVRKETQAAICNHLRKKGVRSGTIVGGKLHENQQSIEAYKHEPPQIHVIVSTDAGAEGINLQAGNVLVNYDLPWNPMLVEQRIGRIQRLASKHAEVIIINLAVKDSPEQKVVARLMEKLQTIVTTIGDIEAILEATDRSDDVAESFESKIRGLVLRSLRGEDVGKRILLEEQSIEEGKQLFDAQGGELDRHLGQLDALHDLGPRMPKLARPAPRLHLDQFVENALELEGCKIVPHESSGLIVTDKAGLVEHVVFDEAFFNSQVEVGVFHGRRMQLCQQGRPYFERLVQRWMDRGSEFVRENPEMVVTVSQEAIRKYFSLFKGMAITNCRLDARKPTFVGETTIRTTSANGVDSYEKLITVAHGNSRCTEIDPSWLDVEGSSAKPSAQLFDAAANALCREACHSDQDMTAFFEFYEQRLSEELGKCGNDEGRRKKVRDDLQPKMFGELKSCQGAILGTAKFTVEVEVDGVSGYSIALEVDLLEKKLINSPWLETCDETNRLAPPSFLEVCSITGKNVLKHLLIKSSHSGKQAFAAHTRRCEVTGKIVLENEVLKSGLSGKFALASQFKSSQISGRHGLLDEIATCEFTNTQVLTDEVRVSEISKKKYRFDEPEISAATGRRGHRSEFVTCMVMQQPIAQDEAVTSDISGKPLFRELAVKSEKDQSRVAAPDETGLCQATGRRLLSDELGKSEFSGMEVGVDLIVRSEESGKACLESELVTCEETGKRILPDEREQCAVSSAWIARSASVHSSVSGKWISRSHCGECEFSRAMVAENELEISQISGRKFRRDQTCVSSLSGRKGHVSEFAKSCVSGRWLCPDEQRLSFLSGMILSEDEAVNSEKSGRVGAPCESARCESSGRRLLLDELARSDYSNKLVDRDLLSPSQLSGRLALENELVESETSNRRVLPNESGSCELTGKKVALDELDRSDVSGRRVLKSLLERCEITGKSALADELVTCSETRRRILPSKVGICELTGKQVALDKLGTSDVSQKKVLKSLLQECSISGKLAVDSELVTCSETGRKALPHLTATCAVTKKPVLLDRMAKSDWSGRLVSRKYAVRSNADNKVCAKDEIARCHWTGNQVTPWRVATCPKFGLTFQKELVSNGLFVPLRNVLIGRASILNADEIIPWIRSSNSKLRKAYEAKVLVGPSPQFRLVIVNCSQLFGLSTFAIIREERGPDSRLVGEIVDVLAIHAAINKGKY